MIDEKSTSRFGVGGRLAYSPPDWFFSIFLVCDLLPGDIWRI